MTTDDTQARLEARVAALEALTAEDETFGGRWLPVDPDDPEREHVLAARRGIVAGEAKKSAGQMAELARANNVLAGQFRTHVAQTDARFKRVERAVGTPSVADAIENARRPKRGQFRRGNA